MYEEGSLIKRSIRDLYNKDIGEVLVAGDEGLPRGQGLHENDHAVPRQEREAVQATLQPIFIRNTASNPQLDAMFSPQVTLPSGGYIVINPTEALVSVDVNSGKSTREHNIEDTALQTNLEAAEEVTRQLRLRDLAGLVVIDFIDMEENKNNRTVRAAFEGLPEKRPGAHPGRPHFSFRSPGNVAPAHPDRCSGELHNPLPALLGNRHDPVGGIGGAARSSFA